MSVINKAIESQLETQKSLSPIVNSFNEWDPLEEVIVGTLDGASVPPWHVTLKATMPKQYWKFFHEHGGKPFSEEQIEAGKKNIREFIHILRAEGVTVHSPDAIAYSNPYSTLSWETSGGLYGAMPRDVMLIVGDQIIEAPMAWRSRYFETNSYRALIKNYFKQGAKWIAAPKPQLSDELYNLDYEQYSQDDENKYVITEFEPVFDAADFIKCGKDIFVQQSHVTNQFGIEWVRRCLGSNYTIHELKFNDSSPMHIDATFMPLAPGKLLINPERVDKVPPMFRQWDILCAPKSCIPNNHTLYMSSKWLNMNIFMLDEKRVMVEKHEEPMMRALREWGFDPIPCNFRNFNTFGGSFHCATLDIRRRGILQSYF